MSASVVAVPAAAPGAPRVILLGKEKEMFRSLVDGFEKKQYSKALKHADTILKKYPNHGETLSMKGLVKNSLNQKEEAYALVKEGLKNDVRSHICWHVFGLLYRSDSNYKEAIKCYQNALKIDANNGNILRDLGWLQIQVSMKIQSILILGTRVDLTSFHCLTVTLYCRVLLYGVARCCGRLPSALVTCKLVPFCTYTTESLPAALSSFWLRGRTRTSTRMESAP
jgi:tetratricopeptide (TPR) repeat protein